MILNKNWKANPPPLYWLLMHFELLSAHHIRNLVAQVDLTLTLESAIITSSLAPADGRKGKILVIYYVLFWEIK